MSVLKVCTGILTVDIRYNFGEHRVIHLVQYSMPDTKLCVIGWANSIWMNEITWVLKSPATIFQLHASYNNN